MKHIYVSPHADDVALSCGGQILANPHRASDSLVLTVFTSEEGLSKGAVTRDQPKFVDAIHVDRDKEDEAAWNLVGVPLRTLGLPEALLRGSFPFSISRNARDREVSAILYDRLASYIRTYPEARFYFPAGIGRHVDHLLCRDVALDLLQNHTSAKIVFYEDAPYWWLRFLRRAQYRELGSGPLKRDSAEYSPENGIGLLQYLFRKNVPFPRGRKLFLAVYVGLMARAGRTSGVVLKTFRPGITTTIIDTETLARKQALVCQYKSQLPMLFGKAPDDLLRKYRNCFATETTIELVKRSA